MSSEALEEALALLDDELQLPELSSDGRTEAVSSFGEEDWTPDELLSAIDDDIGDLHIEQEPSAPLKSTQQDNNGGSGQTLTSPVKQTAKPKRRRRKKQLNSNKARDERRFEVVRLRREVADLELTLQQLQTIQSRQGRPAGEGRKTCTRTEKDDESGVPAVWQDICARQLDRRLKVERENALLKKQCEEEKRLVKSIEKMLFKRMCKRGVEHPEESKHTRRTSLPAEYIKRVAAFIFDELSASVDVCYHEVEGVFAAKSTVPKNVVTHQPILRGGMKGMYRRLFDNRVVPFSMQETGDAWWEYWHNYRGQRIQDSTSNVVTESFGLEMNDLKNDASATSYGQQILRRHVEENRIVFVWNAYIEPFVFQDKPVSGVYLLEQSHVLIKPQDPDSTDAASKDEYSTSMSTCYVITPHFLDPELKNDSKTADLIDFLVSALSSNIAARNERVENLLLDQALQKHHHSV
ncbi:unnamed protein product [Phytophthora lilii]|uniref:Unnamed protein product n=1 Tax=Phytophthora lilii TaxID=2077276 RepID=A0A9W6WTW7_9STRA|nr:unnamed protein product [Phytophthora lilii]